MVRAMDNDNPTHRKLTRKVKALLCMGHQLDSDIVGVLADDSSRVLVIYDCTYDTQIVCVIFTCTMISVKALDLRGAPRESTWLLCDDCVTMASQSVQ